MNKLFFFLLVLTSCVSQNPFKSLKTKNDFTQYMIANGERQWYSFTTLVRPSEIFKNDTTFLKIVDKSMDTCVVRCNVDGDKYDDFLVYTGYRNRLSPYLLSSKYNKPFVLFGYRLVEPCFPIVEKQNEKSKVISLRKKMIYRYFSKEKEEDGFYQDTIIRDTLGFWKGQIIEKTEKVNKVEKVNLIEFSHSVGMGGIHYSMKFFENGVVKVLTQEPAYFYQSKISKKEYQNFCSILNALDFKNLEENFDAGMTDCGSKRLEIHYGKNKVKQIYDGTHSGTLGLLLLYEEIEKLDKKTKWELVQSMSEEKMLEYWNSPIMK